MLKYTKKLLLETLEDRETPSYSASFNGNIEIGGVFDNSSTGFVILRNYSYIPFDDFTGNLNSIFIEDNNLSAISPEKNGGPRVQVNKIDLINQTRNQLFDDFVFEESFTGGVNLAMTDVNSDGFYDLVVGPNIGGGPRLRILSGQDNFKSVLYDKFVYEENYRGGIEIGAFDGKVVTLAKFGGGPHLKIIDLNNEDDSKDFFIGNPNSRLERKLLYGDLLGIRQNYVANYENGNLSLYDLNGKLLTKYSLPYTVYSLGVGGYAYAENNRIMVVGLLNSPYVNNNNRAELIEHDAILNKSLGSLPFNSNGFLGVAVNKPNRFDELLENGFLGLQVDEIVPKPLASYEFVSPFRANLGIVYGGTTIGNNGATGTFTLSVKDKLTGEILGLTNWHVATEANVYSPGIADLQEVFLGGLFIGEVIRTSNVSFTSTNLIDSSLFNTIYDKDISENVLVDLDKNRKPITIRPTGKTTVSKGDLVYGFGRSSAARPGIVQNNSINVNVQYPNGLANFEDQLYILSSTMPFGFASPGDSGSVVMKPEFPGDGTVRWMVTGQIFAGNSIFGIASKWQYIEDIMGVELI